MTDLKEKIIKNLLDSIELDVVPAYDSEGGATIIINIPKSLEGIVKIAVLGLLESDKFNNETDAELKREWEVFAERLFLAFQGHFTDENGNIEELEDEEVTQIVHYTKPLKNDSN